MWLPAGVTIDGPWIEMRLPSVKHQWPSMASAQAGAMLTINRAQANPAERMLIGRRYGTIGRPAMDAPQLRRCRLWVLRQPSVLIKRTQGSTRRTREEDGGPLRKNECAS